MTYASEVLADAPVIYWKMDDTSGTLADATGNGHIGSFDSGPTYSQSPLVSGSTSSVKSNSRMYNWPTNTFTSWSATANTIEFWVKGPSSLASSNHNIVGWNSATGGMIRQLSSGVVGFADASHGPYGCTPSIWDDKPHHLVFVSFPGQAFSTGKIYIDGILQPMSAGTDSSTTFATPSTGIALSGYFNDSADQVTNAYFDEAAFYDYELPASRVRVHYAAGAPGYEAVVAALSPKLFVKNDQASGAPINSGTLSASCSISGTPTYGEASLYSGGSASTRFATGNSAYASISTSAPQSWNAWTICGWFKASDQTTEPFFVVPGWSGGSSIPLVLGMSGTNGANSAKFNAGCFNGSSWDTTAVGSTSIASNGVYFLAATLSSKTSGTVTLYVNGAQEAQTTGHTIGNWTNSTIYIGHQWDSSNMSTGTFQGIALWDSALTPTQIADLYAGTLSGGPRRYDPGTPAVRRSVPVQHRSRRF